MLNVFFRTATVVLLAVIGFLIYNNYIRSESVPDFPLDHAALETPPELPKLAPAPDSMPLGEAVPLREAARNSAPHTLRSAPTNDGPIAEILDVGPAAEVVELPKLIRRSAPLAVRAVQEVAVEPDVVRDFRPIVRIEDRRKHVVQSGESLWVIARKYYGNGELYNRIAEANGIGSNGRIRAGQTLLIPDVSAPAATTYVPEEIADHEDAARLVPASFTRELSVGGKKIK
jgi:LysM repeat protein